MPHKCVSRPEAQYKEGRLAVEDVGINLGLRESQIATLTEAAEIVDKRIRTDRERLQKLLGCRAPAKILLKATTESEWVALCLKYLSRPW